MIKSKIENRLSTKSMLAVIGLISICIIGLGFFGYQVLNALISEPLETASQTTTDKSICTAPLPIGSSFYQIWPLGQINCAWQAFYMTNGIINNSAGIINMSKQTANIKALADQIDTLDTPHNTVQNIMNWMHDPNEGNIQNSSAANNYCNGAVRLSRTADQILSSRCALGCTDWATAFIALARAKGIPSASVETVNDRWIIESISTGCMKNPKLGHVVADVYTGVTTNNGWELADPTTGVFTVYKNNDFSGMALMRFNVYDESAPLTDFGAGYYYRVLRRGIDSWDFKITSDEVWKNAVVAQYGMPSNSCAN